MGFSPFGRTMQGLYTTNVITTISDIQRNRQNDAMRSQFWKASKRCFNEVMEHHGTLMQTHGLSWAIFPRFTFKDGPMKIRVM